MKFSNLKKGFLLALAVLGLTVAAQAQDQPAKQMKPMHDEHAQHDGQGHPKKTADQRVDQWAKDLNLTAEQKAQFLQLEKDHDAKMEAMQKEPKTDASKKNHDAARKTHRDAQRALLTPEQAKKFDEMHKEGKHGGKKTPGTGKKTKKAKTTSSQ